MKRLVIIGAGGHGAVVGEAALASSHWSEVVFLDDNPSSSQIVGCDVAGGTEQLSEFANDVCEVVIAFGDNRIRLSLCDEVEKIGIGLASVIHPSAVISPTATIGAGTVALAGAIVNARSVIGRGCIINTGATIDHDCAIANGVHVSPGANLAGAVTVGECSWIGIGSAVRDGIVIGRDVVVGAGSAVVTDIADGETVAGVPARSLGNK